MHQHMRGVHAGAGQRHDDHRYAEQPDEQRHFHRYVDNDGLGPRVGHPLRDLIHSGAQPGVVVGRPVQRAVCGGLAWPRSLVVTR